MDHAQIAKVGRAMKTITVVGSCLAVGLIAGRAGAGDVPEAGTWNVSISGTTASGALGSAYRTSGTDPEYIGCEIFVVDSGSPSTMGLVCEAEDSGSNVLECSVGITYFSDWLAAVSSIGPDSFIQFTESAGECTKLAVTNGSIFPTKSDDTASE
jgi:hypothetical protein